MIIRLQDPAGANEMVTVDSAQGGLENNISPFKVLDLPPPLPPSREKPLGMQTQCSDDV